MVNRGLRGDGAAMMKRAGGLVLAVMVACAGPALAQQPSAGDIQWAQTILKDKGYNIGGRANGQMTAETRSALSLYQKANGLSVTGQLDRATVDHMMAGRKPAATGGTLGAPRPGGSAGSAPQREVTPRAARTERVEGAGEDGAALMSPIVRAPSNAGGAASGSDGGPVPQAAPSARVTATAPDGTPQPLAAAADRGFKMPGWLSYALMAVIAGTVGMVGFGWWRSGRRGAPVPASERAEPAFTATRREPTFARRDELTAGPLRPLSAEPRARR